MSQSYFSTGPQPYGAERVAVQQPVPPSGTYQYAQMPPTNTLYPPDGSQVQPGPPPWQAGQPGAPTAPGAPRRLLVAIGVLGVVSLGLGAMTVASRGDASEAKAQAASVSAELHTTRASLDGQKKQLDASKKAAADASATADALQECATQLDAAWRAYFAEDYDTAEAALNAAGDACQGLLENGKG